MSLFDSLGSTLGSGSGGMWLQAFGAGYSAMSAMDQASNQQAMMEYQAAIDKNNAIMADFQAQRAMQVGESDASNTLYKGAQIHNQEVTSFAANGVALDSGSVKDVLATTDYMAGRDAATIKQNAIMQAWGLHNQATNYTSNAGLMQSTADSISPFGAGIGSLLSSATGIAKSWYANKQATTGGVAGLPTQ